MRTGYLEALAYGRAVVVELTNHSTQIEARVMRWLTPANLHATWQWFLSQLVLVLAAEDAAALTPTEAARRFAPDSAQAVQRALQADPDQGLAMFLRRLRRNLEEQLHYQRRVAFYRSTQKYRLELPRELGLHGVPPQVRRAEVQLRSTERIDPSHDHYNFWQRQAETKREDLFGRHADRGILDQPSRNEQELLPAPRYQYAPSATQERLDQMTARAAAYESWIPAPSQGSPSLFTLPRGCPNGHVARPSVQMVRGAAGCPRLIPATGVQCSFQNRP